MTKKQKFLKATTLAFASMSIATFSTLATNQSFAANKDMEKCYGVVKAGKNDCASKAGSHSCAGNAKSDGDKNEWILVNKGTCEKLVGGVL